MQKTGSPRGSREKVWLIPGWVQRLQARGQTQAEIFLGLRVRTTSSWRINASDCCPAHQQPLCARTCPSWEGMRPEFSLSNNPLLGEVGGEGGGICRPSPRFPPQTEPLAVGSQLKLSCGGKGAFGEQGVLLLS